VMCWSYVFHFGEVYVPFVWCFFCVGYFFVEFDTGDSVSAFSGVEGFYGEYLASEFYGVTCFDLFSCAVGEVSCLLSGLFVVCHLVSSCFSSCLIFFPSDSILFAQASRRMAITMNMRISQYLVSVCFILLVLVGSCRRLVLLVLWWWLFFLWPVWRLVLLS